MASIHKEFIVEVKPETIWSALKDFGNVHTRLFPGILTDAKLDGPNVRLVTFSNGATVREQIVDSNDKIHRFVYTASGGITAHHNASIQVFPDDHTNGSRIVWISDFLPDDISPRIQQLVDNGAVTMKQTLEENGKLKSLQQ